MKRDDLNHQGPFGQEVQPQESTAIPVAQSPRVRPGRASARLTDLNLRASRPSRLPLPKVGVILAAPSPLVRPQRQSDDPVAQSPQVLRREVQVAADSELPVRIGRRSRERPKVIPDPLVLQHQNSSQRKVALILRFLLRLLNHIPGRTRGGESSPILLPLRLLRNGGELGHVVDPGIANGAEPEPGRGLGNVIDPRGKMKR